MPIYEYACAGCRQTVSIFQRTVSVATAPRCPECGSSDLTRRISKFSFHRSMPDFDDGPDLDDFDDGDLAGMGDGAFGDDDFPDDDF